VSNAEPNGVSNALASALETFRPFLLPDDDERARHLEGSDSDDLRRLAEAVEPLFDEINATLDRTSEAPSLSAEDQELESDLHALAQAGIEARMTLEERSE